MEHFLRVIVILESLYRDFRRAGDSIARISLATVTGQIDSTVDPTYRPKLKDSRLNLIRIHLFDI